LTGNEALGMVHLLLRAHYPVLAQAVQGGRMPHLQLRPGYQVQAGRAAADTRRWGTGTGRYDAWWTGRVWAAAAGRAAVQVGRGREDVG
jgi:hypothetical protein